MKSKASRKKFTILKATLLALSLIVCMFTLSACTWFKEETPAGNSDYDANGKLRIDSVNLHLNRPSSDGSVDADTGSFCWQLNYYINYYNSSNANKSADQINYSIFYDNTSLTANHSDNAIYLHANANYHIQNNEQLSYSVTESGYYTVTVKGSTVETKRLPSTLSADLANKVQFLTRGEHFTNTNNYKFEIPENGYYLVDEISGAAYASRVYNAVTAGALNLTSAYGKTTNGGNLATASIRYPSYNISISGTMYQVELTVDYSRLIVDFNNNQLFKLRVENGEDENQVINQTFKFKYRLGSAGEWKTNPAIISAYQKDGLFYAKFNPELSKGSTSRYIRIQSVTSENMAGNNNGSRGNSVMTAPVTFNVYKLSFYVSANNSTNASYEGLTYDKEKYYFSETTASTNSGLLSTSNGYTYYSSLTGYFVAGRIVEVNRYVATNGDYAFQSWTANGKADNSVVLADTLPANNGRYNLIAQNSLTCLNNYSLSVLGVKLVDINPNAKFSTTTNTGLNFAETIEDVNGGKRGTVKVVSCENTASNNFYANIAKVKNFILSGTVYDGDNFFTNGGSARLNDVDIYIWREGSSSPMCKFVTGDGTVKFDVLNTDQYSAYLTELNTSLDENNCSYYNSQFSIGGLSHDCYITFSKAVTEENTNNIYSFYSVSMTQKDSVYVLTPIKEKTIISDRSGNTIIGTKYDTNSKVNVNIYVTDNNGNALTPIGETKLSGNGITYQVISTTTTSTDVFGYVTSSVIISLLLPSNSSLVSYNLESVNSIGSAIYEAEDGYILMDIGYDAGTRQNVFTYYLVDETSVDPSSVNSGKLLNALQYNNNFYQYTHKDVSIVNDKTVYNYYYGYDIVTNNTLVSKNVIKRSESDIGVTYTHYTYTPLDSSLVEVTNDVDDSEFESDNKVKISAILKYNEKEYRFNTQKTTSSDVAVVAESYQTELKYYYDYKIDESGNKQFDKEKTQNMYVYYNIISYTFRNGSNNVTEHYYTAPLGKTTTTIITNENDNQVTKTVNAWYHSEFVDSNIEDLIASGIVMLGSDILNNPNNAGRFFDATDSAKSIIANNYYYVAPLGASSSLLLSQYISTDATETTTQGYKFKIVGTDEYYSGEVKQVEDSYVYGITGLFLELVSDNSTTGNFTYAYATYNPETNLYLLNNNASEQYLSSLSYDQNLNKILYKLDGSNFTALTLSANSNDADLKNKQLEFINQELNNTIVPNISVGIKDGITYLNERTYVSGFGNESDNKISLTTVYKFYTTDPNNKDITESTIYYDGTNFYLSTSQKISITTSGATTQHPVLYALKNKDGKIYYDETDPSNGDTTRYIEFLHFEGDKLVITNSFEFNGKTYSNIVIRKFFEKPTTSDVEPLSLGTEYVAAIGNLVTEGGEQKFSPKYLLTNTRANILGVFYKYYTNDNKLLEPEETTIVTTKNDNTVVRSAVLASNTSSHVHLLGKVVLLGSGETHVYPSFNINIKNSENTILEVNENGDFNYFDIDYTTTSSVIQAFPGVSLLSGAPYTNPVLYFQVRHKADELAAINIGLELVNSYYVEVITNAITSTTKNIIYDFSTVSFKDTITNLTSNDYIDRMYYVVDSITQNTITAYTKGADGKFTPYLGGNPLTIQNIGINDNDNKVYSITSATENGRYLTPLYYLDDSGNYLLLDHTKLYIWSSSATKIEDLPTYDIHSYYVADNGMIILSSDGNANEICEKLENLFISGTGSTSSAYDYDEILIGGFTSAYRVNAKEINDISSNNLQSFWWETAINISNSYNSTDPYFLTSKEGVVLVANPIVNIIQGSDNIIYRFKRWAVYSRYNSETLYFNTEISNSHPDINNAVMRFTSSQAGYFIFMPIYERVYTLNIGTAIYEEDSTLQGTPNLGGSISVLYDGVSINLDNSSYGADALDISFIQNIKTTINGNTAYRYDNLKIEPVLYYDGTTKGDVDGDYKRGWPNFVVRNDIFTLTYTIHGVEFKEYYHLVLKDVTNSDGETFKKYVLENIPVITSYNGNAGIVEVSATNGYYTFLYRSSNTDAGSANRSFRASESIPGQDNKKAADLFSYVYTVNYYLDGVAVDDTSRSVQSKLVLFNPSDDSFYAIEIEKLIDTKNNSVNALIPTNMSVMDYVVKNGEKFATAFVKKFNSLAPATGDGYVEDGLHFSNLAYLSSGELYSYIENDKEHIYTSQQFKTSYFQRDSRLVISANADLGYRLKDWYMAEYNAQTGDWVVSDKTVKESIAEASYSDIIREGYYNQGLNKWFFVTPYYDTVGGEKIYYTSVDEDGNYHNQSVVADSMLDAVRGWYATVIENGQERLMPVYRANINSGSWYLDPALTIPYTGSTANISSKAHWDAIYSITDGENTTYYLGSDIIYLHNNNYYRTMSTANITFSGNKIYIENLHSDLRFVAKFIEVYQSYIFAEDQNEENITVVSMYYNGTRTDESGEVLDGNNNATHINTQDFYGKDPSGNSSQINLIDYARSKFGKNSYIGYSSDGSSYEQLTSPNSGLITKQILSEDGSFTDLNLVNMNFDVHTTVYIVVKVYYNKTLNIHTLGMNTSYNLVPVVYPTDEFISKNAGAGSAKAEHYFYIFKVTFDRDLQFYSNTTVLGSSTMIATDVANSNYNPEYLIHINRSKSIASDVLSGNYTKYYSNLFNFYDQYNNKIELEFGDGVNASKNKFKLANSYIKKIADILSDIGYDIYNQGNKDASNLTASAASVLNVYYTNLSQLFNALKESYSYILNIDSVSYKIGGQNNNPIIDGISSDKKLSTIEDVLEIINTKFKSSSAEGGYNRITGPIPSGATNFINLSSIPVYTYTTKVAVVNSTNPNEVTSFDSNLLSDLDIKLEQKLYTRGGYMGYTYIGLGTEHSFDQPIRVNGVDTRYPKYFEGNTQAESTSDGYVDLFADNYALAKDTIMCLEGLADNENGKINNGVYYIEKDGVKYVFSGWYEQKAIERTNSDNSVTKLWSDMQLMSTSITRPFESVAYADTNIVALFERAIDLEFVAPKNAVTINFNSINDSLNNPISIKKDASSTIQTISGTFTVSSLLKLDITPSGGYRFGASWSADIFYNSLGENQTLAENVADKNIALTSSANFGIEFFQDSNESMYFKNLNLVKTILTTFVVGDLLDSLESTLTTTAGKKVTNTNKVSINLDMQEVMLTYIQIDGYTKTENGKTALSGLEFEMFYTSLLEDGESAPYTITKNGKTYRIAQVVKTEFDGKNVKNVASTIMKDSAQRNIIVEHDNGSLKIYGYFDKDFSDNLYIREIGSGATLKAWYINEYHEDSRSISTGAIAETSINYATGTSNAFNICYTYNLQNLGLFNKDTHEEIEVNQDYVNLYNTYFNLSSNNFAYLLKAKVEAKSTLSVTYATVDTLDDIQTSTTTNITKDGSISWTGKRFEGDKEFANGSLSFTNNLAADQFEFYSSSAITLTNNLDFYISGDTYYKFIGWFEQTEDGLILVSVSNTKNTTGSGNFVALFAKVTTIDDVYTTTDNASKNTSASIDVSSAYTLKMVVGTSLTTTTTTDENGETITTTEVTIREQDVTLDVYGTYDNGGNQFIYAVVGSKLNIAVNADEGYLVTDITANGSTIDDISGIATTSASGVVSIADITYTIVGSITNGTNIRVVQYYYDSISSNNTPTIYNGSVLAKVNGTDSLVIYGSNNVTIREFPFISGTQITLTFTDNLFGLIGFYVDGNKIKSTYNSETKLHTATFTVTNNSTIEARITRFVNVYTDATVINGESRNVTNTISYTDHYTGSTVTLNNLTNSGNFHAVLSGTVVTFTTSANAGYSYEFLTWDSTSFYNQETNNGPYIENKDVSSEKSYKEEILFNSSKYTSASSYSTTLTANYTNAVKININKVLSSYNKQDQGYITGTTGSGFTATPEFWSLLDAKITYVDVSGNTRTIMLGSAESLRDIFIRTGTEVKVEPIISMALKTRYDANVSHIGAAYLTSISKDTNIEISYFAKRSVTIIRQVNNQESTRLSNETINLGFNYDNNYYVLSQGVTSNTYDRLANNYTITAIAGKDARFIFAGFYVNGNAIANTNLSSSSDGSSYVLSIAQGEGGLSEDGIYYTTDTDLTIIGLWYKQSTITSSITLDNHLVTDNDHFGVDKLGELSKLNSFRLYGNKLTLQSNQIYNTGLQSTIVSTSDKYNYLAGYNLAAIASTHVGYQFVGFYFRDITSGASENWEKLAFLNPDDYNYGDTLTSMISGNKLVYGRSYEIQARYLTAFNFSYAYTIVNQANDHTINNNEFAWLQLDYVDGKFVEITDDTRAGLLNQGNLCYTKYFYPALSTYVAIEERFARELGSTTNAGFFLNGQSIQVVSSQYINGATYLVFDLANEIRNEQNSNLFERANFVLEDKLIKNVTFVARLGINNTNDINQVKNTLGAKLDNIDVKITTFNPYLPESEQYKTTIYSNNNYTANAGDENGYLYTQNNSLYITVTLPIGSEISATIIDNINGADNIKVDFTRNGNQTKGSYLYNGWFMYANHSVANSTAVINYTPTTTFVLSEDTDIVAQFYEDKLPYTTDQQVSFTFNGQDFLSSTYSPSIVEGITTNYDLAMQMASFMQSEESLSFVSKTFTSEVNGSKEEITLTSIGGGLYTIAHNYTNSQNNFVTNKQHTFMFLGWYQEIKDNRNPSRFMYITDRLSLSYNSDKPHQLTNATNISAVFTQVVQVKLTQNIANALELFNMQFNVNAFVPALANGNTNSDILNISVDKFGEYTINMLYDTDFIMAYRNAYGYHYDTTAGHPTERPNNTAHTITTRKDGIDRKFTADSEINAINFVNTDLKNAMLAKNVYSYGVSQKDLQVLNIKATANCLTSDHTLVRTNRLASSLRANDPYFTIDQEPDTSDDIKSHISAQIVSPNNNSTDVVITLVVRFPNGEVTEIELGKNNTFFALDRDLPVGTTIYIKNQNTSTISEVLSSINLYSLESTYFNDPNYSIANLDPIKELTFAESNSIVITPDLADTYLRIVVNYTNVYTLELTDNNIDQGSATISYDGASDTATRYNFSVETKDYYSLEDTTINFTTLSGDNINTTIVSLLNNANLLNDLLGYPFSHLSDQIMAFVNSGDGLLTGSVNNWTVTLTNQNNIVGLTIIYTGSDNRQYLNANLSFNLSSKDSINNSYLLGFNSIFTVDTNVRVATVYSHVAYVKTFYTTETFSADNYSNSTNTSEEPSTIYVFDDEFYTVDHTSENNYYRVITKLEKHYKTLLADIIYNLEFIGYIYAGNSLSMHPGDKLPYDDYLVIDNSVSAGNTVYIEALFAQKLSINIGLDIKYYNNELDSLIKDNRNLLNTPLDNLTMIVDGNAIAGFTSEDSKNKVYTNQNSTTTINVFDSKDYFAFDYWTVKYNDKYLATEDGDIFRLDYTSLTFDTNMLKTIIGQYKASKDFADLDENVYAKYQENENINLELFTICAHVTEEPIEITINYSNAQEQFTLSASTNKVTFSEVGKVNSTYALCDSYAYNFVYMQTERYLNDAGEVVDKDATDASIKDFKVIIAYSKNATTTLSSNGFTFKLTADNYKANISGNENVAKTDLLNGAAVRKIAGENNDIGRSTYLKLNGFIDSLSLKNNISATDDVYNSLQFDATTESTGSSHSTSYTLSTSNLYLVELGIARYGNIGTSNAATLNIDANGTTFTVMPSTTNANALSTGGYAAVSLLVEEGTVIKTYVVNNGGAIYDFKGLAISADGNKSVSDIYAEFYPNIDNIFDASESDWRLALDMAPISDTPNDDYYVNNYYQTLYQYSGLNITNDTTEYFFAATSNISLIADYIGLFKEQKKYITVILNSDGSISYDKQNGDANNTYTGENFVISSGINGSELQFNKVTRPQEDYDINNHQNNQLIVKSSNGDAVKTSIDNETDTIAVTQGPCQVAIGIVTNKRLQLSIVTAQKYKTYNKDTLDALSAGYGSEAYTNMFINGYKNSLTQSAYIAASSDSVDVKDIIKDLSKYTSPVTLSKGSTVTLIAEQVNNANFVGFMVISQNCGMYFNASEQNITESASAIYPNAYRVDTAKLLKFDNSDSFARTITGENNKTYYYLTTSTSNFISGLGGLDGNATIVAVYEPKAFLVNVLKKTYDEANVNGTFKPILSGSHEDEFTTQGKALAKSYVVESGQLFELTILTNGFAEYKGVAVSRTEIGAIYSEDGSINKEDFSDITINDVNNATNENVNASAINEMLTQIRSTQTLKSFESAYTKDIFHYDSDGSTNIKNGVSYGYINDDRLFTSTYSTRKENGKFNKNTSAISYLYLDLNKVESDINLYAYFNAIYYDLSIELGEVATGYTDNEQYLSGNPDKDQYMGTSPYIAYSDEILSDPNFVNPSANEEFGIARKDPYIYTWVDNLGNILSNPVKLTVDMINLDGDEYLTLKKNYNDKTDDKKDIVRYVYTKPEIADSNKVSFRTQSGERSFSEKYLDKKFDNIYDYLIVEYDPNTLLDTYKLVDNLFTIKVGNETLNSGDIVFNYKSGNIQLLDDKIIFSNIAVGSGLFDVIINFDKTSSTPTFTINSKIFADRNTGFPGVTVNRQQSKKGEDVTIAGGCLTAGLITIDEYADINKLPADRVSSESSVGGFLFQDAFTVNEKTGYIDFKEQYKDNLQVKISMAFNRVSKNTEVKLNFSNGSMVGVNNPEVVLTNPNNTSTPLSINGRAATQLEYLQDISDRYHSVGAYEGKYHEGNGACAKHGDRYCNNPDCNSMIDIYQLYVIKNAQMYVDALEYAAKYNKYSNSTIVTYISEILSFNPASKIQDITPGINGTHHTAFDALPKHGSIFDYIGITRQDLVVLLRNIGYRQLANKLDSKDSEDLTFNQLDIYANFKANVSKNFFGNSISYGDAVITVNKMTEHVAPHKMNGIFETRGYTYINDAKTSFGILETTDAYATSFDNNYQRTADSMLTFPIPVWQKVVNWFAGITNRQAKYRGTYTYILHAGLLATPSEFTAKNVSAFTIETTIDLSEAARIKTTNLNKVHPNIVAPVIEFAVGAAFVWASILTGDLLGLALFAVGSILSAAAIIDGVLILFDVDHELLPIHNWLNSLDFSWN